MKHVIRHLPVGAFNAFILLWASLAAQLVKNLPAVRETWVRSLGWEDPLEKGKTTPPPPELWPGEFHGLYSPWGCKELDTTEQLSLSFLMLCDHHHSGLRASSSAQEEIWSPSGSRSPPLHLNPGNQSLLCLYGFAYSGYFIYHFKVFFFLYFLNFCFIKRMGCSYHTTTCYRQKRFYLVTEKSGGRWGP